MDKYSSLSVNRIGSEDPGTRRISPLPKRGATCDVSEESGRRESGKNSSMSLSAIDMTRVASLNIKPTKTSEVSLRGGSDSEVTCEVESPSER